MEFRFAHRCHPGYLWTIEDHGTQEGRTGIPARPSQPSLWKLFGELDRGFPEILQELVELERSLACACTRCLVAFFKLSLCILLEILNFHIDLLNKFFHTLVCINDLRQI